MVLVCFRLLCSARDTLNTLIDAAVMDVDNFNWISQLRYYWRYDDIGTPHNMLNSISKYIKAPKFNLNLCSFSALSFRIQIKLTSSLFACSGPIFDMEWNIWGTFHD